MSYLLKEMSEIEYQNRSNASTPTGKGSNVDNLMDRRKGAGSVDRKFSLSLKKKSSRELSRQMSEDDFEEDFGAIEG